MRKLSSVFVAAFIVGVSFAVQAEDWASKKLGLMPKETKTETVGRRTLKWYEHAPDPAWGAAGNYTDKFTVAAPVSGEAAGAPLVVQLHSRGGGMPAGGILSQAKGCDAKEGVYRAPDEAYVLALDSMRDQNVQQNKTNPDFWWGGSPKFCGPAKNDVPRLRLKEQPCAMRVMDTIEWVVRTYKIDRNRIYLCGNSMGGQGALALGLPHGDVFAAVEANVPATIWYPVARMGFVKDDGSDDSAFDPAAFPDPPVCYEWSGSDDVWSRDHEVLYRNMAAHRYFYMGVWGDYGHCGDVNAARAKNDLVEKFDYLQIRKDAAYPVFTKASCDDQLPWPFSVWKPQVNNWGGWAGDIGGGTQRAIAVGAKPAGQVNAFFRWKNVKDEEKVLSMELRIATAEELGTTQFTPPASATADVSFRRIQKGKVAPGQTVKWRIGGKGGKTGSVTADENGLVTIPEMTITQKPQLVELSFAPAKGAKPAKAPAKKKKAAK